jgi:hypothetical protein
MGILHDVAALRDGSERGPEALGFFDREAEGLEESRFPAVVGMSSVEQVVNDFLSLDDSEMSIAKSHVVSSLS